MKSILPESLREAGREGRERALQERSKFIQHFVSFLNFSISFLSCDGAVYQHRVDNNVKSMSNVSPPEFQWNWTLPFQLRSEKRFSPCSWQDSQAVKKEKEKKTLYMWYLKASSLVTTTPKFNFIYSSRKNVYDIVHLSIIEFRLYSVQMEKFHKNNFKSVRLIRFYLAVILS